MTALEKLKAIYKDGRRLDKELEEQVKAINKKEVKANER